MTVTEWVQIIGAFFAGIVALVGSFTALKVIELQAQQAKDSVEVRKVKRRQIRAAKATAALQEGVEVIHKLSNSMKDELVREVRAASFAAGEKAESDKQEGSSGRTDN